jgi:glycosyltransferase involved in cell wall biosynthesis
MRIFLVDFFTNGHHLEYAKYLGRHMLEQGHEVTLWTWRRDHGLQDVLNRGLKVRYAVDDGRVPLPKQTLRMISPFCRGLRNCLAGAAKEQADIVHLLYLDRAMPLPLWWNRWRSEVRTPIFGTLFWPYHFLDIADLGCSEKLYRNLVRKSLRSLLLEGKLAGLFVHTERVKNLILRTLRLKSLEDRCVVVPDPLPDPLETPNQAAAKSGCRMQLGLPQDRIVFLYFGELRDNKGPEVLLRAIRSLPRDALVVFAGTPEGTLSLRDWEEQVRGQGLDGRVRLDLRRIPDNLLPVYFQAADAVVLPYRRSYLGTSGVLQWAACLGRPVIATNVGDVGDLVRQYGLGLVAEPDDPARLAAAINQYMREREAIEAMVTERAPLYRAQHHWRQTAASVLRAYECVVHAPPGN